MADDKGVPLADQRRSGGMSPFGEMKGLPECLGKMAWVDAILRGASQVVFMNNPVSGLFIIAALAYFNWRCALFGVLALVSGTVTAIVLHRDGYEGFGSYVDGLYGFNAVLVGLGIGTFCEDAKSDDYHLVAQTAAVCIIFGVLSTLVMNSLAKWMPTAPLTLPFNICIMWFFGGTLAYTRVSTDISPHLPVALKDVKTCLRSTPEADCDMQDFVGIVVAALRGVCQIYLANNTISAVLILVGMAFCSPLAAIYALIGSTAGLWTGIWLGVDGFTLFNGMYGFNPALTAIAVGGGIFAAPSPNAIAWAVFGAVVTAFLYGTLCATLASVGLPAFTLPFCLATVFHLGAGINK